MGWPHSLSTLFRYRKSVTLLFFCLASFSFDLHLPAISSPFRLLARSQSERAHPPFQKWEMGQRERRSDMSRKVSPSVGGQHGA